MVSPHLLEDLVVLLCGHKSFQFNLGTPFRALLGRRDGGLNHYNNNNKTGRL